MLYGLEVNEPYQVQNERKFRCWLSVSEDENHTFVQNSRVHRAFATENQEFAESLVEFLPESMDARVEPHDPDEGTPVVFGPETEKAILKAFRTHAREADRQRRQIR